jgi:hypothetical protein
MKSRTFVIAGRAVALLFALAGLLFGARALYAQVDAGSILGTVTDASGAVISGATVTLTNEGTAASLSTTTSSDGLYKFSPVKIGSYKIDVVLQGFQPMTAKGVVVNIGASAATTSERSSSGVIGRSGPLLARVDRSEFTPTIKASPSARAARR